MLRIINSSRVLSRQLIFRKLSTPATPITGPVKPPSPPTTGLCNFFIFLFCFY
jgi:hypothetical protein